MDGRTSLPWERAGAPGKREDPLSSRMLRNVKQRVPLSPTQGRASWVAMLQRARAGSPLRHLSLPISWFASDPMMIRDTLRSLTHPDPRFSVVRLFLALPSIHRSTQLADC